MAISLVTSGREAEAGLDDEELRDKGSYTWYVSLCGESEKSALIT